MLQLIRQNALIRYGNKPVWNRSANFSIWYLFGFLGVVDVNFMSSLFGFNPMSRSFVSQSSVAIDILVTPIFVTLVVFRVLRYSKATYMRVPIGVPCSLSKI